MAALRHELEALVARLGESGQFDARKALRLARAGVAATPGGGPEHGWFQFFLGHALTYSGVRTQNDSVLAEALQALRTAVALIPETDPDRSVAVSGLASALQAASVNSDDPETAAAAVEAARASLAGLADDEPLRPLHAITLASSLRAQGEQTHDVASLGEAVTIAREAVQAIDVGKPYRHVGLSVLGWCLFSLFLETRDPGPLAEAITALRDAITSAPDGTPEVQGYWSLLGVVLEDQYDLTQDPDTLAQSIDAERAAETAGGVSDLDTLARRLDLLAKRTGRPDMLDEAAEACRSAIAATPAGDSAYPALQSRLRQVLETLFERTGDLACLREAITAGQAAVTAKPDNAEYRYALAETWHSLFKATGDTAALSEAEGLIRMLIALPDADARAEYLTSLSVVLHLRYEQTKDPRSLAEAIALQREAIVLDPGDPTYISNLGAVLCSQFEFSGDLDALTEGLSASRAAVAATPPGDPDQGRRLGNLAAAALTLFERTGDPQVLTEAVNAARAALAASADMDSDESVVHLTNLTHVLHAAFTETGDQALLAEAVNLGRTAVAAVSAGSPNRARLLSNHAAALATSYLSTGDYDLLVEATDASRAALAISTDGQADHARLLSNLAMIQVTAYGRTGDLGTLVEAVEACRACVAASSHEEPAYPRYLSNLAMALATLLVVTGDQDLAAEALDAARGAVSATPENSPDRARCQSNLGTVLVFLYFSTDELEALNQAIEAARAAAAIGPGHSLYGLCQANLAQDLAILYQRTGSVDALTSAEQSARAALSVITEGQPLRTLVLGILGVILFARYGEDERQETLTEAIAIFRQADASSAGSHPDHARLRVSLATALGALFDETGDLSLLAEAVTAGRAAIAVTPEGGPYYARASATLGRALRRQYEETGQPEAIAESRATLAKAAWSVSPVRDRVLAGLEQARAETLAGDEPAAAATMEDIMALMPLVAPNLLRRADREHRLGEIAGVGEIAAATALATGNQDRALEFLEQARGQLLGEAMDARANLRRLRLQAPHLADEFEKRRRQPSPADLPLLIAPESGTLPLDSAGWQASPENAGERAGDAADNSLLERIRSCTGLNDFLTVPSVAQLSRHAKDGPIVMVSAAWNRGDALILTPDLQHPVLHVPLPGLTSKTAAEQAQRLFRARRTAASDPSLSARPLAQLDLHEVLGWLWDTIAEPVLNALGYTAQPEEGPWPRLWWSPVGILSFLPLHAAGHHHHRSGGRTVLDRAISSYTATIRALAYSRQQPATEEGTPGSAGRYLIVAMPETPEAPPLSVQKETAAVSRMMRGATILQGPGATHDSVVTAMPACQVAHFACHGISDWEDPNRSRLLLHDHLRNPLTVGAISRLELPGPELAYLSACSTTDTSIQLADEAVHITSAFQLAGYRNVIGTLWPVSDDAATQIAEGVYGYLTKNGTQPPDTTVVARALHHTTRGLRADFPNLPTAWAAHVHTGM